MPLRSDRWGKPGAHLAVRDPLLVAVEQSLLTDTVASSNDHRYSARNCRAATAPVRVVYEAIPERNGHDSDQ